jgi:hypothetical protein
MRTKSTFGNRNQRERSGEMGFGNKGNQRERGSLSSPPSVSFAFPSLSLVKLSCPSFLGFRRIHLVPRRAPPVSSLPPCAWCSCEFEVGREVGGSDFFAHSSSLSFGAPNEPENSE